MRRLSRVAIAAFAAFVWWGCQRGLPEGLLAQYQGRTLYTCCNIHYETEKITDANYHVGQVIPFGTPVQIVGGGSRSVTFNAAGKRLTLFQEYGTKEESLQQYIDKMFVSEDPRGIAARSSNSALQAIKDSRVEVGMTKEQVLLSLGYPPVHRTSSTASNDWLYWMNRWITYRVQFDDSGRVSGFVGTNVPTRNEAVKDDERPAPAPVRKVPPPPKKKK